MNTNLKPFDLEAAKVNAIDIDHLIDPLSVRTSVAARNLSGPQYRQIVLSQIEMQIEEDLKRAFSKLKTGPARGLSR